MRHFLRALALLSLFTGSLHASPEIIRKSLVRVQTVSQEADYSSPWNPGGIGQGIGAGFVIDGNRVLTNAHVVSDSRKIWITREGDSNRYPAKILHIAHDCDLAVLQPLNLDFFKGMRALEFNGIPEIESAVMVYGYPIGGETPSVTRGIVSRVDFQEYSHSGTDSHLVIQIDAAINPGNSGGPVVQEGKVVGVAFQGYSGDVAQNTGYMIPTPVIKRFLKDIADGHYDHYVDLALNWSPLYNPAARHALGLPDDGRGVIVAKVFGGGSAEGIVKPRDVILSIDGHAVASDGSVELDGSDVELAEVIERKFKGDKVKLEVVREGKPLELVVPLNAPFPLTLFSNAYDVKPRYVVFAGLVFQPLDENFVNATPLTNSRTRYYFDHFLEDDLYKERPELVILSNILSDPVNAYADEFRQALVDTINGRKINRLDDVAAAFAEPAETYVIEFAGASRPLVLEAKAVAAARERILRRYGVTRESNLQP
jgi:S1-C subfamily serine protease